MAPTPPNARRAPNESWRSSIRRVVNGAPTWPPTPPSARSAAGNPWRSSILPALKPRADLAGKAFDGVRHRGEIAGGGLEDHVVHAEVAQRFHLREQLGARLLARQAEPRAHGESLRIAPGRGTRRPQVREPVLQRGRRRKGCVPAVAQLGHAAQRARRVAADPDGNAAARRRGSTGQLVEAEELAG